jgi:hypothetical protein
MSFSLAEALLRGQIPLLEFKVNSMSEIVIV